MKKAYVISFAIACSFQSVQSQNTFPSSGDAGIGTLSPSEKLHIYRNQSGYYNPLLVLEDDLAAGYTMMALRGTGRSYHIGVGNASESGFSVANKFFIFDNNASIMRMVVDASGNLGVGTATPGNRLSIYSATASTSGLQFARLNNSSSAVTGNGKVLGLDASGNVILVNDATGTAGWSSTGNSGTNSSTDYIGTADAQDLVFRTNNTERYRIFSNGNFRVGSGTDKGKTFQVYGTGYFSNSIGIGTDSIGDTDYRLFVAQGIRTRKVRVDIAAWPDYVFNTNYRLPSLNEVEKFIQENKHLPGVAPAAEIEKEGLNLGHNQALLLKKIEELTLYIIDHHKELQQLEETVRLQQSQISELNKQLQAGK